MKKTILIILTVFTVFFGIIGSGQSSDSTGGNTPIKERPPLGDEGPGGDDGN